MAAAIPTMPSPNGGTAQAQETVEAALRGVLAERGLSARKGLQPVRVAVTGSTVSPPLFESLVALGRERTLARLHDAAGRLGSGPGLQ